MKEKITVLIADDNPDFAMTLVSHLEKEEDMSFPIIVDGVEKNANMLTTIDVGERSFAIYYINQPGDKADIMYSEIVKDPTGNETLVDVDEPLIREQITTEIGNLFK